MIDRKKCVALAALCAWSGSALGATFKYRARGHQKNGDCHVIAQDLGEKFERVTGIRPASSLCTDISDEAFAFEVTYQAEEKLKLVTTSEDGLFLEDGVFETVEACEAKKAEEVEHFRETTGLEPVI